MLRYVVQSGQLLLYVEWLMKARGFSAVHGSVRKEPVNSAISTASVEEICRAVDLACVLYFKPVLCLQRSAATTLLLRRQGYTAELVVGVQLLPFQSHAWVEVDHRIVNDKPYLHETFQTIQRC